MLCEGGAQLFAWTQNGSDRHARAWRGHPRLHAVEKQVVDGRIKSGHDDFQGPGRGKRRSACENRIAYSSIVWARDPGVPAKQFSTASVKGKISVNCGTDNKPPLGE
jgi:hypothetical protein